MKILVTGSRTWTDEDTVRQMLDAEWAYMTPRLPGDRPTLIHGACPTGADAIAARIASSWGWPIQAFPANWKDLGKRAGFVRNEHMINLNPDVCLAFIEPCISPHCTTPRPHDSHGAAHTYGLALERGIRAIKVVEK